jgi:hypothetical protein
MAALTQAGSAAAKARNRTSAPPWPTCSAQLEQVFDGCLGFGFGITVDAPRRCASGAVALAVAAGLGEDQTTFSGLIRTTTSRKSAWWQTVQQFAVLGNEQSRFLRGLASSPPKANAMVNHAAAARRISCVPASPRLPWARPLRVHHQPGDEQAVAPPLSGLR